MKLLIHHAHNSLNSRPINLYVESTEAGIAMHDNRKDVIRYDGHRYVRSIYIHGEFDYEQHGRMPIEKRYERHVHYVQILRRECQRMWQDFGVVNGPMAGHLHE